MTHHPLATSRAAVRRLVDSIQFQWFIIVVILINAVVIGLQVSPRWMDRYGDLTELAGRTTVAIAVVPGGGSYSVLRVLRQQVAALEARFEPGR